MKWCITTESKYCFYVIEFQNANLHKMQNVRKDFDLFKCLWWEQRKCYFYGDEQL